MATIKPPSDPEKDQKVKAVFDDIRATRGTDFINNVWRYLAFDPDLLAATWAEVKAVMATPSALEPKVKEMIYAAVSISNSCDYCTHSHLAAARSKGMTEAEFADFLRVVSSAGKTNHLLNGLRIPVDAAFLNEEE
ncbi:carboxymuconolactone decarboxylase family protein [Pseudothioclava arenosa]|uniref:Alkylhydroperoxidase n=1 Tax=Pseudothioclava arenosa TaxID=1795308 RepID=A0A2A4CLJ1_9RHOB|nr:carboxymuconolactone decarboxylase family protein [Pseudothioclava arenosa]PCD76863.1 alkylhydroperoxidase [Pseudothioclava arenosa]